MINFTFKKSQMTQVSLTSVVNYGPRNQEVADRVKSILGMDHDLSSAMSSSVSLSSDKVSISMQSEEQPSNAGRIDQLKAWTLHSDDSGDAPWRRASLSGLSLL